MKSIYQEDPLKVNKKISRHYYRQQATIQLKLSKDVRKFLSHTSWNKQVLEQVKFCPYTVRPASIADLKFRWTAT